MTQEEIKAECKIHMEAIQKAAVRLEEIRSICTHPNTEEGIWSWRIGSYDKALICQDCRDLVKTENNMFPVRPIYMTSIDVKENIAEAFITPKRKKKE